MESAQSNEPGVAGGAGGAAASTWETLGDAAAAALMERGAKWLRENDLGALETQVTTELQSHPIRTLAVAAGIGFLISRRS